MVALYTPEADDEDEDAAAAAAPDDDERVVLVEDEDSSGSHPIWCPQVQKIVDVPEYLKQSLHCLNPRR